MKETKTTASPVADQELPAVLQGKRQLGPDDSFSFGCHKGLPCFTDCCADINILLTPLDVLGMARALKMDTGDFVRQHTLTPITKDLHLPVKVLKMGDDADKRCPFVGDGGCTIYEDRPWSCRMYPLGMGIPPARAGEIPEPVFFLFEDAFCKGGCEQKRWTVREWRKDQKVPARERIEQGFRAIVSHPYFIGGTRSLDPKRIEMFDLACYDLDRFRRFVFESSFLKRFEVDDQMVEHMRGDDVALLEFAFVWLRYAMFGEPTLKVRADAPEVRREA